MQRHDAAVPTGKGAPQGWGTPRNQAIVALVLMTAIWGTSFPMMKCLNLQIDQHFGIPVDQGSNEFRATAAAWIIALRCTLSGLLFVGCFPGVMRRVRGPHLIAGASIGLFFFLGLMLQIVGLGTIPASRSGFLTSLTVVMIPLFTTLLGRRIPPATVLCSCLVAMLGVATLTNLVDLTDSGMEIRSDALAGLKEGGWTVGDWLTIFGAVFFSGQIMLVDWFGKRYESIAFTPSMFGMMALCGWITWGLLLNFAHAEGSLYAANFASWIRLGWQPEFGGLVVALAVFPSLLAFTLMNKYQPRISATQAGIIYTLEPVFASTFAMFMPAILSTLCRVDYPNETFTVSLLAGGLLVLTANVLALWPTRAKQL
jgi:drug/metabolite transporter (DMT)-like permease